MIVFSRQDRVTASARKLARGRPRSFEGADIPGRVTNAGLTRQTGNDSVEFVRLDRLADQPGYDFGDICGPMIETSTS